MDDNILNEEYYTLFDNYIKKEKEQGKNKTLRKRVNSHTHINALTPNARLS